MAAQLKLKERTVNYLKNTPLKQYTARELSEWFVANYPEAADDKLKRAKATAAFPIKTKKDLVKYLTRYISYELTFLSARDGRVKITEDKPRKYSYSESTDGDERSDTPTDIKEYELYPKLAEFLSAEFDIHSKIINASKAIGKRSRGENKWLYPDVVGMENLSQDWKRNIKEVATVHGDKKAKLWSFEVKIKITSSDVRECFFQAVSNSSWANYAYLVASDIPKAKNERAMKELRILSSLHGVGVILLNYDNPSESEVKIPAQERPTIDWNVANRLAETNNDFDKYIEAVIDFYKTDKIHPADWYKIERV